MANTSLQEERDRTRTLILYLASQNFYTYVQLMGPLVVPGFKDGRHIEVICKALQTAYETEDYRLMVNLPPGSCKSILCSVLFPSWIFGRSPSWQILHIGHTADFIAKFGAYIRDLMDTAEYKEIFPLTKINEKFQARDDWETTKKGVYRSAGAGGAIAGKRGNLGICDDIVSEQTAKSKQAMEALYDWWPGGFESRLLEGGRIVYIATRWSKMDPAEWLLNRAKQDPTLDQWVVISIPALLTDEAAKLLHLPEGESYWPEVWKTDTLKKKKLGMPTGQWASLYMQTPIDTEGNIFKLDKFKTWTNPEAPDNIESVIVTMDTAFSTSNKADYSVLAIWGVFRREEVGSDGRVYLNAHTILLELQKGRWEYPDLVARCAAVKRERNPDLWVIEKKASGQSLLQDLRRRGYFVYDYLPDKDKVSRANASTPFIDAGRVWIPKKEWTTDFLSELAAFPTGAHDDCVDVLTMLILWLRDSYTLTYEEEPTLEDLEDAREASGVTKKHFYW